MKLKLRSFLLLLMLLIFSASHAQKAYKTKNVVIILIDGYRWEELFKGADFNLLNNKKFNTNDSLQRIKKYWSEDLNERRKKLMPFTWNYIAAHGQLYGNREWGNEVSVRNPYWISYPGRAEVLSGFVDDAINSNSYPNNPNPNLLEFLNKKNGFKNKVATFACWRATGRCLNPEKYGLMVNVPWQDIKSDHLTETERLANEMQHYVPHIFGDDERLDANVYALAKAYILAHHPKVTYIDFGDTDEYAHDGKYDKYLDDIYNLDSMIANLWEMMKKDPFYKDNTSFFIVPDHGRGIGDEWTDHGSSTPHSNETWFMVLGPDTKPLGEMKAKEQIFQTQYASTIAALLGFDYKLTAYATGEAIGTVMNK
ncbi:MAG: phosphoglyceromutase [Bacteroidetes bacterium]|nr:phosphoglyceromutase [Bacteroidota bacterium]MBS1755786.1 phosphoglyceromutase [Bacteroidota bacterium]